MRNDLVLLPMLVGSLFPLGHAMTSQGDRADQPSQPVIGYTIPKGWQRVLPSNLVVAAFEASDGSEKIQIRIACIPGDGGGIVANVKRWRAQLGLKQIEDADIRKTIGTITVDGIKGESVD